MKGEVALRSAPGTIPLSLRVMKAKVMSSPDSGWPMHLSKDQVREFRKGEGRSSLPTQLPKTLRDWDSAKRPQGWLSRHRLQISSLSAPPLVSFLFFPFAWLRFLYLEFVELVWSMFQAHHVSPLARQEQLWTLCLNSWAWPPRASRHFHSFRLFRSSVINKLNDDHKTFEFIVVNPAKIYVLDQCNPSERSLWHLPIFQRLISSLSLSFFLFFFCSLVSQINGFCFLSPIEKLWNIWLCHTHGSVCENSTIIHSRSVSSWI